MEDLEACLPLRDRLPEPAKSPCLRFVQAQAKLRSRFYFSSPLRSNGEVAFAEALAKADDGGAERSEDGTMPLHHASRGPPPRAAHREESKETNMPETNALTIGDLAARTGLSVSAIRFYEEKGLVEPFRSSGGQRRFLRSDIRRLSFVLIAQQLGLSIGEIERQLAKLPHGRTPTQADWTRISKAMRGVIDARIAELERTRERLDGCIGCGCLSLKKCALYNPEDRAGLKGPGPQLVLGD